MRKHVADVGLDQRRCKIALNKARSKRLNVVTAAAAAAHPQHSPSCFVHTQIARAARGPHWQQTVREWRREWVMDDRVPDEIVGALKLPAEVDGEAVVYCYGRAPVVVKEV